MTQNDEYKRGMVVVAHADDAEYGCSGTVARWCAEGMEVVYVLCTDGSKGSSDPEITQEELVQIRQEEQIAVGKVLGLKDVVFLGYEDSVLQPTLELRRDIAREIRRHRPDILICPYPMRNLDENGHVGHPDHTAAGEAALSAVFPTARDHLTFPELIAEGLEAHKVKEVLILGHPHPDKWINVTKYIDTAIQALLKHKSQMHDRPDDEIGQHMHEWRQRTGQGHEMEYAEAFKSFHFRY